MPEPILDMLSRAAPLLSPENLTVPGAMLLGLLLYLLCFPFFFRRMGLIRNLCIAALFLYAAAVLQLAQCLPAAPFRPDRQSAAAALNSVEWNPALSGDFGLKSFRKDLLESFLILMPVGILAPLAGSGIRLGKMLLLSVLCGAGLEAMQLLANLLTGSAVRGVRTQDAVLSAAGCLLGYLVLAGMRNLAESRHPARHYARSRG